MLRGMATMVVGKEEIIHALNEYFYHQVRDSGLSPYATVVDVRQQRGGDFILELEGNTAEPQK